MFFLPSYHHHSYYHFLYKPSTKKNLYHNSNFLFDQGIGITGIRLVENEVLLKQALFPQWEVVVPWNKCQYSAVNYTSEFVTALMILIVKYLHIWYTEVEGGKFPGKGESCAVDHSCFQEWNGPNGWRDKASAINWNPNYTQNADLLKSIFFSI